MGSAFNNTCEPIPDVVSDRLGPRPPDGEKIHLDVVVDAAGQMSPRPDDHHLRPGQGIPAPPHLSSVAMSKSWTRCLMILSTGRCTSEMNTSGNNLGRQCDQIN
jgi:hypothetical protein